MKTHAYRGQRLLLTAFDTAPVGDGLADRPGFNEDRLRSVRRQDRKRRRVRTTVIGATAAVAAAVAATVLDAAAAAIGSDAGAGLEPNVVWGSAPYYHMVSVTTCGGETYTNNTWTTRNGNGVGLGTGPKSASDPGCGADDGAPFPIITGFADFYGLGNQPLTEAQVDELPTDPNKLWPILVGFDGGSLTSDPANPHSNASTMFQSIWNLKVSVAPATTPTL